MLKLYNLRLQNHYFTGVITETPSICIERSNIKHRGHLRNVSGGQTFGQQGRECEGVVHESLKDRVEITPIMEEEEPALSAPVLLHI